MTSVSITALITSLRTSFLDASTIEDEQGVVHEPEQIKENIVDAPTLQIYPVDGNTDRQGENDRTSFGASIRQTTITVYADYYARQRSHIGEDLNAVVEGMDALINVLEAQQTKPYFGNTDIKSFAWRWEYVTFAYGEQEVKYSGVRFIITLYVF